MPATVTEKFESRIVTTGQNPTAELHYNVFNAADEIEARNAVLAVAPAIYDPFGTGITFISQETVSIEPVGETIWEAVIRYANRPQTNDSFFEFDTGGGTQHITQSIQNVGIYTRAPFSVVNLGGAIGVSDAGVEGVDIPVPVYNFSETHYLPASLVTLAYRGTLFFLTGKVNNAPFKGLAAGECLFLGASGSQRGGGDWEINFRFAASPNVSNLNVGGITVPNKKGWEYLWVRYQPWVDGVNGIVLQTPANVYVEQVYHEGNFANLGIGT